MLNPRRPYWTAEEDRRLGILWEAGWSVNAIATTIGRSRGAVTGRRYRLGLAERECPIPFKRDGSKDERRAAEIRAANDAARREIARCAA